MFSIDTGSLNLPGLLTGKAGIALALLEAAAGQQWMPGVLSAGLLQTDRPSGSRLPCTPPQEGEAATEAVIL